MLPEPVNIGSPGSPCVAIDGHHPPLSRRVDEGRHLAPESERVELHHRGRQNHGQARVHGIPTLLEDLHSYIGHQGMPRRHGSTQTPDLGSGPLPAQEDLIGGHPSHEDRHQNQSRQKSSLCHSLSPEVLQAPPPGPNEPAHSIRLTA